MNKAALGSDLMRYSNQFALKMSLRSESDVTGGSSTQAYSTRLHSFEGRSSPLEEDGTNNDEVNSATKVKIFPSDCIVKSTGFPIFSFH